ncbi:hypothetical protein [Alkalihalobacillus sp. 1P02AB]|uniref:hypothetical protein n=1 Tax=Alkalihalobacillus sp. 1P02AB TaxID=3132260 RepID=UPI0039A465D8
MYLIDQVTEQSGNQLKDRVYLIDNGKIKFVNRDFAKWNQRRVNMSGLTLKAGLVVSEEQLLETADSLTFFHRQEQLVNMGCTTAIVFAKLPYESRLEQVYKTSMKKMEFASIDYVLGLEISLQLLRPSVILTCKRKQIPALKVVIKEGDDPSSLAWLYIAQVQRNYRVVLMPHFVSENEKERAWQQMVWKKETENYAIAEHFYITEEKVWTKCAIQKIGLYPEKGTLMVGSDLDYFLYENTENQLVEDIENLDYHYKKPSIVVLRGQLLKINEQFLSRPGFGRAIYIKMPGRLLALGSS